MGDDGIMKLGPVGRTWDQKLWDEKGRTTIAQIFISHGDRTINSIQFQYLESGSLKLSEKHGSSDGYKFDAVNLKPKTEYITSISGHLCSKEGHVCSVTFGTNAAEYGPFGTFKAGDKEFCFNLGVGGEQNLPQFAGFHGTVGSYGTAGFYGTTGNYTVNSIGVYLNPKVKLKQATEHITWIRGRWSSNDRLCSITFGTNRGQYGPFGSFVASDKEFCLNLGGGGDDPPQFERQLYRTLSQPKYRLRGSQTHLSFQQTNNQTSTYLLIKQSIFIGSTYLFTCV